MENKLILGIESSCDDTSVALIKNFKIINCFSISSSSLQSKYGGVLPELAAREHEKNFIGLLKKLLISSNIQISDISHIAYTLYPGLPSSLLVGQIFAKSLALLINKSCIPVNHVYGHIFSPFITNNLSFPHLSLVISGKTTALYLVKSYKDISILDKTNDNALGEVYDKVARMLSLPYPGGPEIDRLFNEKLDIPPLLKHQSSPLKPFSYSGILSATTRLWEKVKNMNLENKEVFLASVFQKWVIESLLIKLRYFIDKESVELLTISGGVSANKYLRRRFLELPIKVVFVDRQYSSDNAAMIAFYAANLI